MTEPLNGYLPPCPKHGGYNGVVVSHIYSDLVRGGQPCSETIMPCTTGGPHIHLVCNACNEKFTVVLLSKAQFAGELSKPTLVKAVIKKVDDTVEVNRPVEREIASVAMSPAVPKKILKVDQVFGVSIETLEELWKR